MHVCSATGMFNNMYDVCDFIVVKNNFHAVCKVQTWIALCCESPPRTPCSAYSNFKAACRLIRTLLCALCVRKLCIYLYLKIKDYETQLIVSAFHLILNLIEMLC